MDSYNDIWNAVLEYFRERISVQAYQVWIDTIRFDGIEGTKVKLHFANEMKKNIVVAQYDEMFKEAFEAVMGFKLDIEYTCDEEKKDQQEEKEEKIAEFYKSDEHTFDNFIVGPSNRFVYAAAKAVAADPGGLKNKTNYNPLFIYGNSGLGKTHILNAICHEVNRNFPEMRITYVKAEEFTNEFLVALQRKSIDEFHNKYRNNIDLFLVDDIQFIGNKEQTIEEFFHTFSALRDNGKQIVLTSDRLPKEIPSITDRLKTRFEDGLLADIQPPEFETRCAIIKRKAQILNFDIPEPVVEYIAERVKTNIRHLESVTKKLQAMQSLNNQPPTIAFAQCVIKDILVDSQPLPITIQRIVEEVSRTTGIAVEDIYGKLQKANISHARKMTFYVIRKVTNMSYEAIGEEFKKHHSTVMYNINEIEKEMEKDSKLERQINNIISNVKSYQ